MLFPVEDIIGVFDRKSPMGSLIDGVDDYFVARLDRAGLNRAKIPTRFAGFDRLDSKPFRLPTASQFPARLTGLGNFEHSVANGPTVSDGNVGFVEPFDGEIFAKCSTHDIITVEKRFPIVEMPNRIDADRFVNAAVILHVGLSIPVDASSSNLDAAENSLFVKSCSPRLLRKRLRSVRIKLLRPTDLDGGQRWHDEKN